MGRDSWLLVVVLLGFGCSKVDADSEAPAKTAPEPARPPALSSRSSKSKRCSRSSGRDAWFTEVELLGAWVPFGSDVLYAAEDVPGLVDRFASLEDIVGHPVEDEDDGPSVVPEAPPVVVEAPPVPSTADVAVSGVGPEVVPVAVAEEGVPVTSDVDETALPLASVASTFAVRASARARICGRSTPPPISRRRMKLGRRASASTRSSTPFCGTSRPR